MIPYVIQPGDYLAKLAHRMNFDLDEVWNHASNKALREARNDHNILAPGDVLHVPEPTPQSNKVAIGSSNQYVSSVPRVSLRVSLKGGGQALAGKRFVAHNGATPAEGTLGSDALLELEVPISQNSIRVDLPELGIALSLRVGNLNPAETVSGATSRLVQLGFLPPAMLGSLRETILTTRAIPMESTGMNDSPGNQLHPNDTLSVAHDRFKVFLMFKSQAPNSIWVTLSMMEWFRDWIATRMPTGWVLSDANNAVNPSGRASTELPSWRDSYRKHSASDW